MLFWLSFLVSVVYWPLTLDPAEGPRWAVMAVGAPLGLLLLADKTPAPLGGFGVVGLLTIIGTAAWAPDIYSSGSEAIHLLILGAVFCLGAAVPDLKEVWKGLTLGIGVSVIVAIAQLIGWSPVYQFAIPGGLFINKEIFAEPALIALIAMWYYRFWLAGIVPLLAVLMCTSRTVGFAAVVAFAFAMWPAHKKISYFLSSIAAGALVFVYLFPPVSLVARYEFWQNVMSDLTLFGHGLGSFTSAYPFVEYAHSEPMNFLYEFGILCAIPASFFIYLLAERLDGPEPIILVAVLAIGIFWFPLHMPLTGFATALAAGHVAARRCRVREFSGRRVGTRSKVFG